MNHPSPFRNRNALMENEMCSILDRKMPTKSVLQGQVIDPHSVVAFFHKAKWTQLAITHEINRWLAENTINRLTVGKYVRMFVLSTKETGTPLVPELEGDFSLDDRIALVLREAISFSPPNW